jgi:hypothetical protein
VKLKSTFLQSSFNFRQAFSNIIKEIYSKTENVILKLTFASMKHILNYPFLQKKPLKYCFSSIIIYLKTHMEKYSFKGRFFFLIIFSLNSSTLKVKEYLRPRKQYTMFTGYIKSLPFFGCRLPRSLFTIHYNQLSLKRQQQCFTQIKRYNCKFPRKDKMFFPIL